MLNRSWMCAVPDNLHARQPDRAKVADSRANQQPGEPPGKKGKLQMGQIVLPLLERIGNVLSAALAGDHGQPASDEVAAGGQP